MIYLGKLSATKIYSSSWDYSCWRSQSYTERYLSIVILYVLKSWVRIALELRHVRMRRHKPLRSTAGVIRILHILWHMIHSVTSG